MILGFIIFALGLLVALLIGIRFLKDIQNSQWEQSIDERGE